MAIRPFYMSTNNKNSFVKSEEIEFQWFSGFSVQQKQKSIQSLHTEISKKYKISTDKILEVSSKSENILGVQLSAFNLGYILDNGGKLSVECMFQASKVFEHGGPYSEILKMSSLEAKKYPKLKTSGKLLYFLRKNEKWELEPKTAFYDWIYLNTLKYNTSLIQELIKYEVFTDIEFNPKKSINCQASSVALFVSLYKENLLDDVLQNKDTFIDFLYSQNVRDSSRLF